MEFNEKLQELRKQKGITQEELAEQLYVSRTAVSKWESGRGYPNIDSLKAISKYFSVTVDELLSPDEVLTIAEKEGKQKEKYFRDLIFGLLDLCIVMLLFLPLFASRSDGGVQSVSLLKLYGIGQYLKISYCVIVILTIIMGIIMLALQNCQAIFWVKSKTKASLLLSIAAVTLFIVSLQPYAAIFAFSLAAIKAITLMKF